jgi:hypothetical protein
MTILASTALKLPSSGPETMEIAEKSRNPHLGARDDPSAKRARASNLRHAAMGRPSGQPAWPSWPGLPP